MRKKTVNHLADTIFWYLIYFLPVIAFLLYLVSGNFTDISLDTFFNSMGVAFTTDNVIITSLSSIFGVNGILPLFVSNSAFYVFSWFIISYIVHLFVDFILFIPRLCHKWLKTFTQGD